MAENTRLLPETAGKSIPPIIYAAISNALQVYGILVLGWHFFPILYLWWWEELVFSVFGVLKLRRMRAFLLQQQPETEVLEGERSARGRFFLLFVYFVFVVVMGGFMFAPRESYVANVITLVFRNNVFNFNLLLFIGMQIGLYWRDFYKNRDFRTTDVGSLRNTFDLRSLVIHVGLLAGALLSFLLQKYGLFKTEHAFMFGFMGVKTFVELWAALNNKPASEAARME